jgi:hypothetical protein
MPNLASGTFGAEKSDPNRAAACHTEACWRRRPEGTRNMTVACDGGAGAQAGVRHRDGRRATPHDSGAYTRLASVQRVKAHAARCFSFITRRSTTCTVSSKGRGGSAVRATEFRGTSLRNQPETSTSCMGSFAPSSCSMLTRYI